MDSRTPHYKIVPTILGNRYHFFCDLSGALVCTSKPIRLKSKQDELEYVWLHECKKYFNQCHKCGKWIIDAMYNAEVLECVQCAPYEETPLFCKSCGSQITTSGKTCSSCGMPFIYEGGAD